ncbi:MAG: WD40 repeat domain-containing protein [Armatimonadota bacterium]|jgi:WD40 repeat protein|nr:WD40 repeat domain-containing protein [Armatimonadota bacterium]
MAKAGRQPVRKLWLIGIATTLLATSLLWLFSSLSLKPLRLIRTWKAHKSLVTSLTFLPDGQRLLSASWDGTVRVWEVNDGTKMDEISFGRPIRFATLSPDGQLLAISTYDPTIQLWRLSDKTLLRTLTGHKDWVHEVFFSPDGKFLISGSKDGTVKVWQVWDGSLVRTLSGHSKPVVTVALSPDGQFIASGSEDSTVRVWRMADGKLVKVLQGHMKGKAVNVVRFSPDGKWLAFGDIGITIYRFPEGRKERIAAHRCGIAALSFTPDNRFLISASSDGMVKVWQVLDGVKVGEWKSEKAVLRAWAEQADQTLFRLFGFNIRLHRFFLNIYPSSFALSPDGRLLAAGFVRGEIRLWQIETE